MSQTQFKQITMASGLLWKLKKKKSLRLRVSDLPFVCKKKLNKAHAHENDRLHCLQKDQPAAGTVSELDSAKSRETKKTQNKRLFNRKNHKYF